MPTKKPYCLAPLTSFALWADGRTTMCCEDKGISIGNWNEVPLMDIINSPEMKNNRKKVLEREILSRCEHCLKEKSKTDNVHTFYENTFSWDDVSNEVNPDTGEVTNIRYLLMGLGNLCNYSCRMCYDGLSTTLSADRSNFLGTERVKRSSNDISNVVELIKSLPDLQAVTFHGGNPMMMPEFVEVLEVIDSKVQIEIITNGSTFKAGRTDVLEKLERFDNLIFNISMDGTREVTEYIRSRSNYDTVISHINTIKERFPNAKTNIHACIMNNNLFNLPLFFNELLYGELSHTDTISTYIITDPIEYCVHNLPTELRSKATQMLRDYYIELTENGNKTIFTYREEYILNLLAHINRRIKEKTFSTQHWNQFLYKTKQADEYYNVETLEPFKKYVDMLL